MANRKPKDKAMVSAPNSAAHSRPETDSPIIETCCDRLITQIATLDCVLGVLEQWDLSGRPIDKDCRIGSAELALRQIIETLHDIAGDVSHTEDLVEKLREVSRDES
jgi:hypothetical protein